MTRRPALEVAARIADKLRGSASGVPLSADSKARLATWAFLLAGAFALLLFLGQVSSPREALSATPSPAGAVDTRPEWPEQWTEKSPLIVAKVLVKNGVAGCGELQVKASRRNKTRFLVRCNDGRPVWNDWLLEGWNARGPRRVAVDNPPDGYFFPMTPSSFESDE